MLFHLIRPLIFLADAEAAHGLTIAALKMLPHRGPAPPHPRLAQRVAGIDFPNPVGLAPGFDKNAEVPGAMLAAGFGFAEIGTVTPRPQAGNPRPRLFRLAEDRAVINRMGFNNQGSDAVLTRLRAMRHRPGIIGVNIGANKDNSDRITDYAVMTRTMAPYASYITVNISSPNTPGLRALQDKSALDALLQAVLEARGAVTCPIFLKLAPDLTSPDISDICDVVNVRPVDALIVANTTITRPALKSVHSGETGGLSGAPLHDLALQRLRDFRRELGDAMPLIGVGGIATADQAYARIRAGASLVQLYSALVYEGPMLAKRINAGLEKLLERDGLGNVAEAVGLDA